MEINGLPVHALIVHATVVFGPLAAIAGLLHATVPRWRDWLRWPLVALVAVATVSVWVSYLSGESIRESNAFFQSGTQGAMVETHEDRAGILRIAMTAFAVVSFAAAWLHTRTGVVRVVLSVLVGLGAVATLVYVVLTGDAGAQIAWSGIEG